MAKRVKQTGPALQTRDEMEGVVGRICALTIKRDGLVVQMDEYIQEVRDRYQTDLTSIDEQMKQLMALARDWAEANPADFGPNKSIEMTHGAVGFRTGMPALKTLSGWTWAKVLAAMKNLNLKSYIRTKEEIDKDAILAERKNIPTENLRRIGLKIHQDEAFFIDPKREPMEGTITERKAS
jgi:phage host-nuclease inhibitor protein Gam